MLTVSVYVELRFPPRASSARNPRNLHLVFATRKVHYMEDRGAVQSPLGICRPRIRKVGPGIIFGRAPTECRVAGSIAGYRMFLLLQG